MGAKVLLEDYRKETPEYTLEDLYGLEYEKTILRALNPFQEMDEMLVLPYTRLFLFFGPDGYGKHTLAEAYAGELSGLGYEYFAIDGEELLEEENAAGILRALFCELFRVTSAKELSDGVPDIEQRRCYLVIDHLDALCADKEVSAILARMLKLLDSDDVEYATKSVVICGISSELSDIPNKIRAHMNGLELQLPKQEQRMEYFADELTFEVEDEENDAEYSYIPVEAGVPEVYLAEKTAGFSYGELRKLVMLIKMYYKQAMYQECEGNFRRVVKNVKASKTLVTQELIETMVERLKKEKSEAAKVSNLQNTGQAPQVIFVGGEGIAQNGMYATSNQYAGYPQNLSMPAQGPKNNFDEDVVDVNRFAFLKTKEKNPNMPDLANVSFEELDA